MTSAPDGGSSAIRLLVSDVDGTLANSDKGVSAVNEAAIRAVVADGVPVTLISARPPSGMMWIVERLELTGPFGAFNGGTILDRNGTVGTPHRLDPEMAREVAEAIERLGAIRWLFADGDWVTTALDDRHTAREVKSAGLQPIVTGDLTGRIDRVDKLVAVSDDDALLTRVEEEVRRIAGDRATVARSQPYYLDVTAPRANKGDGLATLAEAFGVALEQVAVLGDGDNDLPMFARAGLSVAMGQAGERVRGAADVVAATNDEDGVADAIARFVRPGIGVRHLA